jgi:formamidopyrimidine-DNA glycosylase
VPELPDLTVYLDALRVRTLGKRIERIRIASPSLLRTFDPPFSAAEGKVVRGHRLVGKRLVFELDDELSLVVHLMIAGRLRWERAGAKPPAKIGLASFEFDTGTLVLVEASSKKRAALHVLRGAEAWRALDAGGVDPLAADDFAFVAALRAENRTLKRALTDPHVVAAVGNAYSDEILHRARLSPMKRTRDLGDADAARLRAATREVLVEWIARLRAEAGDRWPVKVTAFRKEMAVHGRFGLPCPTCGASVQRVVYAENEANYCAPCQTGGKLLADRGLSRLLKDDWPRTLEDLEERKRAART